MDRRERLLLVILALATSVAVLGVGGAPRWSQAIVALLAAAAVAMTITSRRGMPRRVPLLVMLLGVAGWTAIQLLPLPGGLVEALSPTLSVLRDDGATTANVSVASTLSMDVPGTLRGLSFLLTLSALAIVAMRLAISDRGRYALHACVASVIGLAALVAGIHELFGATDLYGIYEARQAKPTILGPLLNPNHFGCLMAVGAVTAGGLLMYPKQSTSRRIVWIVIAAACIAVLAMTLSRGAMLALGIGVALMLAVLFAQRALQISDKPSRRRRERFLATTVPISITVVCGVTIALYIGAGSVMQQLENTSLKEIDTPTSKFAAWRSSVHLIEESPWVGIGRGAFEPTFTRVHPASAFATFSHPENIGLQAVVDWGIPIVLLLAVAGGWLLVTILRRWRDGPLIAGALGVIGVVGFQSNFDFGLELLGVAVPFVLIVASASYVPLKSLSAKPLLRARLSRVGHVFVVAAAGALLLLPMTESVEDTHVALAVAPTRDDIQTAIERHPLDYYAYAVLAEQMVRAKEPHAIRVLNHALRLHPTHPGLHRLAARLLLRTNRTSQAESEYMTAIRYSVALRPVLVEATKLLSPESAVRAIPTDREPDHVVRTLQEIGKPELAVRWLSVVLERTPTLHVADVLHSLAMTAKDYKTAEQALRARCKLVPNTQCRMSIARVLVLAENWKGVAAELSDVWSWSGRRDEKLQAWLMLCDAQLSLVKISEAKECLHRLDASGLAKVDDPDVQRRRDALAAASSNQAK